MQTKNKQAGAELSQAQSQLRLRLKLRFTEDEAVLGKKHDQG